jgi:small subunit ribosomal protein S17
VRIEECAPISKRKTWIVTARNGTAMGEAVTAGAPAEQGAAS